VLKIHDVLLVLGVALLFACSGNGESSPVGNTLEDYCFDFGKKAADCTYDTADPGWQSALEFNGLWCKNVSQGSVDCAQCLASSFHCDLDAASQKCMTNGKCTSVPGQ